MEELAPTLILLIPLVVGLTIFVIASRWSHSETRRNQSLARLAEDLGWSYTPERVGILRGGHERLEVFQGTEANEMFHTLRGSLQVNGRVYQVAMGDFFRKTEGAMAEFSYVLVALPFPWVPDLLVRRRGTYRPIAELRLDHIDFESGEFNDRFAVWSSHRRLAYDLFHARMMAFFLLAAPPRVELRNACCFVGDPMHAPYEIWTSHKFRRMAWWTREFLELWPEHVAAQLEFSPTQGPGAAGPSASP